MEAIEIVSYVWLPTLPSGAGLGYCYSAAEAAEAVWQYNARAYRRGTVPQPVTVRVGSLTADGEFIERSIAE